MLRKLAMVAALVLSCRPILAEEETTLVLIPVYTSDPLAGANGSSWATDLWASNWGDGPAGADGLFWDCFLPQCGAAPVGPGVSFPSSPRPPNTLHGALIHLDPASADQVGFALRFRDLSRQAETAGTALPTPRGSAFRGSKFSLLDVPVEDGFRQTLRIYELDGADRDAVVRVRAYRPVAGYGHPNGEPDELLGETTVALNFFPSGEESGFRPGYAEITDLAAIAPLGDAASVRLEIEPVTAGLKLWAFVTVIHDETQHATVISPN